MNIKEPKRWMAFLLTLYILWMAFFSINNITQTLEGEKQVTGKVSSGQIGLYVIPGCTITVLEGFNQISFCKNLTSTSVEDVLSEISGKYEFVLKWNQSRQQFDTFSQLASKNDFTNFSTNESYIIFMKENATLSLPGLPGTKKEDVPVPLQSEFNSVTYPYTVTINVSLFLDQISGNISFALKFDETTQEFLANSPQAAEQEFNTISRGDGLFVFVTEGNPILRYNRSLLLQKSRDIPQT